VALSLSVCIPTFNRAALLRDALLRLETMQQCFREIVISDNASPDGTSEVVAALRSRFAALTYFRQAENRGVMPNFHAALSLGTSDLLFALSDDDAMLPDGVTQAVALLENDPDCVAIYGGYERSNDDLQSMFTTAVPQRTGRFTATDIGAVAQAGDTLTLPIVRRDVFQRHCFFDNTTFGLLRLVAQMVQHGAVRVVEFPFYRHVEDSPHQTTMQLTQPWFLESHRSDWELFAGILGNGDFSFTAQLAACGTVPLYSVGSQIEAILDRPLSERSFLIRYLAYAAGRDRQGAAARIADWEKKRLIAAAMERLAERLSFCSMLKRVIIEQGRLNIGGMWDGLSTRFPDIVALRLDADQFATFATEPGDFLLAEQWASLERRANHRPQDRLAVTDLIRSLRLPGSLRAPLLLGPGGVPHFSMDIEVRRGT
jgi:glycosyltransferase involved in cell wall biosynthesis